MNNVIEVYNELKELLGSFVPLDSAPVLIIKDQMGGSYVVFQLNLEDCTRGEHLVFSAYYKDSEIPDKGRSHYSVALPIGLYAGIELHADLPNYLHNEHKDGRVVGFKSEK